MHALRAIRWSQGANASGLSSVRRLRSAETKTSCTTSSTRPSSGTLLRTNAVTRGR